MAGMIDFSPFHQGGIYSEALDPIAALADDMFKKKSAREHQERQLGFQREQEQRLSTRDDMRYKTEQARQYALDADRMGRADREERRLIGSMTERNLDKRTGAYKTMRQGVEGEGPDSATARQTASDYAEVDPATGEVKKGLTYFKVQSSAGAQLPDRPDMEPVPQAQEGPMISKEDARNAAFIRSGLQDRTSLAGNQPGMTAPGNIDLTNRPNVRNPDGSVSTVRSMGVNMDGKETLIPTVGDEGRVLSDDDAVERYRQTGRHLGQFDSPASSDLYANQLHLEQERSGPLVDAAEAERQRFAQQQAAPNEAMTRNSASLEKYNTEAIAANARYDENVRNPQVQIGDTLTSQGELRYARANADAGDFEKQIGPGAQQRGPDGVGYAKQLTDEIRARGLSAQDASKAWNEYVRTGQKQDFASAQGALRDQNRLDVQKLRNQAPRPSFQFGKANVDVKEQQAFESTLQHFQQQWKISDQRFDTAKLQALADNPDEPIAQRAIASVLSRQLAGEKGVLTDQDIARLQKNLAGFLPEIENWFSKGATGALAPEILAQLQRGIGIVIQQRKGIDAKARKAYYTTFIKQGNPFDKQGLGPYARNRYEELFGTPLDDTEFSAAPSRPPSNPNAQGPMDPSQLGQSRRKSSGDLLKQLDAMGVP